MNRFFLTVSFLTLPIALPMALSASARENVEVRMTLQGDVSDNGPDGSVNAFTFDGKGHVNLIDIDLAAASVRIVGLHVEFDVSVCVDPNCTSTRKIHYTANFDNFVGVATGDPNNPNTLFVEGNPTSGMVHRSGGGAPDKTLLFADFKYSAGPTVGYSLVFVFTSPDGDMIQVGLAGPA